MSDYIPTTEAVRDKYASWSDAYPEFDRWLAEVKALAWEEGYNAKWAETWFEDNPYRQGESK